MVNGGEENPHFHQEDHHFHALLHGHTGLITTAYAEPPVVSSIPRLIEDLVQALDSGETTRGGPHISLASTELIFALIESHRRGGARVTLPVQERTLRLQRSRGPNKPKYTV